MNYLLLIIVVVLYLLIVGFLGYLGYKQTKTTTDYLLAGRRIHPLIMAISYGATFISTSAIVGFGGAAAVFGMGILWLTFLNIFAGIFIAFVLFGKRTRKMGHNLDAHTFPELIGKRYQSKGLQLASGLLIFIAMPLYAGSVIIGGTQFISQTLGIPYEIALFFFVSIVSVYVIAGGLKGVMYTDAFQGGIMFIGMSFLLVYTYYKLGGIVKAHQALTDLSPLAIKVFGANGHLGWTKMPALGSPYWWQLISTIVMGVGIGVLAQPQLIVRFMTVKNNHELNRAVIAGGIFILMMTGVAFTVGALTNVFFVKTEGVISLIAAGKKTDNIIPLYINKAMPFWFTSIFLVTLLAAAMSTLSSQFHTMGTAFGRDFLEKGLNIKSDNSILISKIGMIVAIIVSTIVAYFLPKFFEQGSAIIAIGTALFFGLCASSFLPLYFGAIYTRFVTRAGAWAGFISGLTSSLLWMIFVHSKESTPLGICKAIFKVNTLLPSLQYVDPLFIGLPLSIIFTIVFSLFTKKIDDRHLDICFKGIK